MKLKILTLTILVLSIIFLTQTNNIYAFCTDANQCNPDPTIGNSCCVSLGCESPVLPNGGCTSPGTFTCAADFPIGSCTTIQTSITCKPGFEVPFPSNQRCDNNGYSCGGSFDCVPETASPIGTNTFDCSTSAVGCQPINEDCNPGYQPGVCGTGSYACGSIPSGNGPYTCIASASLPNTCACNADLLGSGSCTPNAGQLKCQSGYECPCYDTNCNQSNLTCILIGTGGSITPTPIPEVYDPCKGLENANLCRDCLDPNNNYAGSWTGLGCLPIDPGPFASWIVKTLFGLAGGVAFLLIIYGAFICIISRGDPQKVQACKETITSAVIGILMLIFSLGIVRLIFGSNGVITGFVDIF